MKKIFLILFALVLLIGCNQSKDDTIKIGAIFSLTGDVGPYGQRTKKGFDLAIEEINKSGGIDGKKIAPIIMDGKSAPKDALAAYTKMKDFHNVSVIVGDIFSSTTMAIVPNLEKDNIFMIAPGASHPDLSGKSKYFFRNWLSDNYDGLVMARYLISEDVNRIGVLAQTSDYTMGLANAFIESFKSFGGEIIIFEQFKNKETNFRSLIEKFKDKKISAIYLVGQSKENGTILKQAYELNYYPKWYSNLTVETPECLEIAQNAADGVIFSTPAFTLDDSTKIIRTFVNLYKNKYNSEPEAAAAHSYDVVKILSVILDDRNSPNPDTLRKRILEHNFVGVTGNQRFDINGNVIKDVFIKKINNRNSTLLKQYHF